MTKKRVLIFSTAYLPFIGGAEVAVKEITDRLPDIEFVMITARLDKKLPEVEKIGNIEVHRLGRGNKWDKYRLALFGHRKALQMGHFGLIWGIMASYGGFAALKYKKRSKKHFLLTLQEGDSRWQIYKHVWFIWPYFKQIFKRADKIQAISSYLADWAKDMGAGCDIEIVPNGVDLKRFKIEDLRLKTEYKRKLIEDLNISENTRFVITVSRLVKKNGVEDLIKAMNFLPEEYHLLIVGEGELKRKLKELTKNLKLIDRVHFVGPVNYDKLSKYLWASNVFCRSSLSEGLGNAFLEAMAAGLPIIGTRVGGIPDFLEDGKIGWFCEVKNPESIAEKIKYVLDENNKEEIEKVIENAKKLVQEKYSWDLIASKMKNIFETV